MRERIYRLTGAGRHAWESQDLAVPADYRRLLWLLDFQGHAGLLRELVTRYPRTALDEWLDELEELGLIEQVPPGAAGDQDFVAPSTRTVGIDETEIAGTTLARSGAYLAADRMRHRPRWTKTPAETVILIVEDEPDQRALADLRVSMAGYQVRLADSERSMLQSLFDHGAPDLLLLDVALPDGDGFEILSRIRRHKAMGALPIILLTVKSDPQDVGKGLTLGADGYVTKPYTKSLLADVIARVLGRG